MHLLIHMPLRLPQVNPYLTIPTSVVGSPEHMALARQAAAESIVLLKNGPPRPGAAATLTLPLQLPSLRNVTVVGPLANQSALLLGNYFGKPAGGCNEGTGRWQAGCRSMMDAGWVQKQACQTATEPPPLSFAPIFPSRVAALSLADPAEPCGCAQQRRRVKNARGPSACAGIRGRCCCRWVGDQVPGLRSGGHFWGKGARL